jgi:sugar phosphate isomerase/epimerase
MLESTSLKNNNKISFGISSIMEFKTVDSMISQCKHLHCDFVELNSNFPQYVIESLIKLNTLKKLENENINYSIHLPETLDFGSFQSEFRDSAVSMIARFCDIVKPGTRFIYHANNGIQVSLPDEQVSIYEKYDHDYLDSIEETLFPVNAILEDAGCNLCVENLGNFNRPYIYKSVEMMLSYPSVGLLWDVGHDATSHFMDTPFFEKHLDDVLEIHLHDSKGKIDHLPLFSGIVDIEKALSFAKERSIPTVIEVKTIKALEQSINELTTRGLFN